MVCDKCEKKLGKVVTPDPWKAGARNTTEGGGRKVGENKALSGKKARFLKCRDDTHQEHAKSALQNSGCKRLLLQFNPYQSSFARCKICRQTVHQQGSHYCQGCAYKKGICAMCGKKIIQTTNYRQSST